MNRAKDFLPPSWIARFALMGLAAASVIAQAADPYPQPQPYPQAQYPQQQQQQGADQHPMRSLFASSLAQVAQATGSAAVVMVADGLTGALKGWFDNRRERKNNNGALGNAYTQKAAQVPNYPAPNYPPPNYPPGTQMPAQNYPAPATDANGYPLPGDSGAYQGPTSADGTTGGYSSDNGYASADPYGTPNNGYQVPAAAPASDQLYAGIAYEVHLLQPDGSTMPVDPLNYTFRTGEQFRVYYRPSLPGRVDVFSINAAGQEAQIDSSVVAAGELASLGPYEFTLLKGQETLIIKLSPCATPATYAVTRNIVKAQVAQNPALSDYSPNNKLGFDSCSNTSTRGLKGKAPRTRDIRKVSVEGGTSFALDPIGANELGGGDMSPRQITITLMHR